MLVIYSILILFVLIAAGADIATKKIPNWCLLIIAVSGLSWNCFSAEGMGLQVSMAGLIAGLLLMLPGYVFASMGAGDVKFMAAIGSVVGLDAVLNVALDSYIAILVMAVFFITAKGDLAKLLFRYKAFILGLFAGKLCYQKPAPSDAASYRLPLAPAMAIATFYVLYPEICKSGFMGNVCHL